MDNKAINSQLDDIVLDVGADCELIHTTLRLFEDHAEAYKRINLPSNLTSDFVSLVVRFLADIEENVKKLEGIMDALREEGGNQCMN